MLLSRSFCSCASGPVGWVRMSRRPVGFRLGRPRPSKVRNSPAPTETGSVCTVPKQGPRYLAAIDGSISCLAVAPIRRITLGRLGWLLVSVAWWKKFVRPSTHGGRVDQTCAALTVLSPSISGAGATRGSAACGMSGKSYVPGALALTGSPRNDVLSSRYCALLLSPQANVPSASA